MVTVSYIVDDMCQDINSFYTDRNKSLEDNLKGYYAARVKYWLSHPDHFVIIYNLRSNLRSNSNYELKTQFLPLKEKFSSALNNKTIEIIHTANVEKNIPDDEIVHLNLPTAVPYIFEFDDNLNFVKDYFLGDPEEIKKLMDAVAHQGKKSK